MLTTVTSGYDTGDRTTNGAYVHDALGRATKIAKADTIQSGGSASDVSVGFYANDMVAILTQTVPDGESGTVVSKQDFGLDGSDRVSTIKGYTAGVQLVEQTNHYDSSDDAPSWSETKTRTSGTGAWQTAWTRNITGLGGDLALTQDDQGRFRVQLANLHDDLIASIEIGATGLDSFASYTEYGLTRDGSPDGVYGWVGGKQRQNVGIVGSLTLMGARLYNPTTGRFLSRDPVPGGNDNTYTYPPDPINKTDLNGEWGWSKKKWKSIGRSAWTATKWVAKKSWKYCGLVPGAVGTACIAGHAIQYGLQRKWKKAGGAVLGLGGGHYVAKVAGKFYSRSRALPSVGRHAYGVGRHTRQLAWNFGHQFSMYGGSQMGAYAATHRPRKTTRWMNHR